ncbi:hypothetical protein L2E82_31675 [Cichorium intybus]|uniref:Uncharacterized protein n=1 Tax=Cichorium intybus TaxID=13427 RepID=A0ACB9BFH2_CICIN|nr:hypothetical protein L2E82_31675 [Cichorium intybus]
MSNEIGKVSKSPKPPADAGDHTAPPTPATTFHSYSDDAQPRAAISGQISLSTATHSRLSPSSAHTTAASYRTPPPASAALCSLFLLSGDAHLRSDLTLDSLSLSTLCIFGEHRRRLLIAPRCLPIDSLSDYAQPRSPPATTRSNSGCLYYSLFLFFSPDLLTVFRKH